MAYQIIPKSIKDFINMPTKLPRFQRKKTWSPQQNFNLCISIFKNYPIGVVVINNTEGAYWVLDGRQRLEALEQMSRNPEAIYDWAVKFIKFKQGDDANTIRTKFYKQIANYLEKPKDDSKTKSDGSSSSDVSIDESDVNQEEYETESGDDESLVESSFSTDEQKNNFKVLLDLILMVHKKSGSNGKSKWQRNFDFSEMFEELPYYKKSDGKIKFFPTLLTEEIHKIINYSTQNRGGSKEYPIISPETFTTYFRECIRGRLLGEPEGQAFLRKVEQNWSDIYLSIETIKKADKIMRDSIIGIIELTKASNLDAQNIFELINKGGTKLTAEELLSAKPYWNVTINNVSQATLDQVKYLYDRLDVEPQNDVVRWDLCATLIFRLPKAKFIFGKVVDNNETLKTFTTLGFKLFSAIHVGGINNVSVASLETRKDYNWETEYETFVAELNQLCELIGSHPYFVNMVNWDANIRSLLSDATSLEFLSLMYREWKTQGKPTTHSSAQGKQIRRYAVILMDKLIFEYSNRIWRGSSDSRLARDLLEPQERLKPKSKEDWIKLIEDLINGKVNDHTASQKDVSPVLYHCLFLSNSLPMASAEAPYQIDHIIPQSLIEGNPMIKKDYKDFKDSLTNLQVLSAKTNNSKKDKKLNEVFDNVQREEISRASGINTNDFDKYSSLAQLDELKDERKKRFLEIIENNRIDMLGLE